MDDHDDRSHDKSDKNMDESKGDDCSRFDEFSIPFFCFFLFHYNSKRSCTQNVVNVVQLDLVNQVNNTRQDEMFGWSVE